MSDNYSLTELREEKKEEWIGTIDGFLSGHGGYRRQEKRLAAHHAVTAIEFERKVCGVALAQKIIVPHFNHNYFFEFQQFLLREHAEKDIDLAAHTFRMLDSLCLQPGPATPVGILFVPSDGRRRRTAFWKRMLLPELGLVLAGFTRSEDPIYVHYFSGARISK